MLRAVPIMCLLLFSGACLELIVTTEVPTAFDELEHISYAAYLQETGKGRCRGLRSRKTLRRLDGRSQWGDRLNYLGIHRPFTLS